MSKGIKLRLVNGVTPLYNLTNLICLWWDQTDVYDFDAPIGRTNEAVTDTDGYLILDLSRVSGLAENQEGFLVIYKELDELNYKNAPVFAGVVPVCFVDSGTVLNYPTLESTWKRNPDWQIYTEPSTEKFVGLYAVFESGSNFLALSAEGNYTVNWGDGGSTENFNSGVVAYHTYDYTAFDSGKTTQGAVTFTDSTNTVNKNNHGRLDGETVSFASITTTTGITVGQIYYVINASTNTYQLSETLNGSAINLTNDGSGYTLKYKTVVVQVYPQGGANLTKLDLHKKHTQSLLQAYSSGWLDISLYTPNCTDLRIGVQTPGSFTQVIIHGMLEQINIISSDLRQLSYLFYNCYSLQNIKNFVTSSAPAVSMSCTFTDSGDLVTASNHGFRNGDIVIFTEINSTTGITDCTFYTWYYVINTDTNTFQVSTSYGGSAVTLTTNGTGTALRGISFYELFYKCYLLESVPLFDTSSGINFSWMFDRCALLKSVPLFDTSNGIYFSWMLYDCAALQSVPLFDTSSGLDFREMFEDCYALESVPLFNTSSGIDFYCMFNYCSALKSIPLFDTSSGINFSSMFQYCNSLESVPLLDTSSGINFSSMFYNCNILKSVPLFDTSSGINFSSMFNYCFALESVPLFDTSSGTSFSNMFDSCNSLTSVPLFDTSSGTSFSNMFYDCFSLELVPLFDTSSGTSFSYMFQNNFNLKTIPLFDTSSGVDFSYMFIHCARLESIPLLNMSNFNEFSNTIFEGCNSLSKGALSGTRNNISYSGCKLSGDALDEIYTNLASVTAGGGKTITVSNNWGTADDDPTIATNKGWTVVS
jgi:hypothetical protein